MNARKLVGIALAMLTLAAGTAWAGSPERVGTGGAPELRLPVGARSVALAGSDLGTISGAEALFYNPAGIVESKAHTEVMFSHTQYIADMKLNYIAVTQAVGNGCIGVSAKVLSIGEMTYTTETAPDGTGETFSPTYSTLGLSYARRMTDRVDFGLSVLYDAEHVLQERADGVSFGFGFIYDTNFHGAPSNKSVQHDCRPVTIGHGCRIGSRVTITRGVSIGDGAEILAGSVVSSVIPPGVCAAGGRARIIGRAGDMASRWESAAASLPDVLMAALGLDFPPDLDGTLMPPHVWTGDRAQSLLKAIEDRFRVSLDTTAIRQTRTFADVASAVQRALQDNQSSAGRS